MRFQFFLPQRMITKNLGTSTTISNVLSILSTTKDICKRFGDLNYKMRFQISLQQKLFPENFGTFKLQNWMYFQISLWLMLFISISLPINQIIRYPFMKGLYRFQTLKRKYTFLLPWKRLKLIFKRIFMKHQNYDCFILQVVV